MSEDKRISERKKLTTYLQVFNRTDNQVIGYLADFSGDGMMLITKNRIGININFELKLMLPKKPRRDEVQEVAIDAKSVRCDHDANIHSLYNVGFMITEIDPMIIQEIEQWLHP